MSVADAKNSRYLVGWGFPCCRVRSALIV